MSSHDGSHLRTVLDCVKGFNKLHMAYSSGVGSFRAESHAHNTPLPPRLPPGGTSNMKTTEFSSSPRESDRG